MVQLSDHEQVLGTWSMKRNFMQQALLQKQSCCSTTLSTFITKKKSNKSTISWRDWLKRHAAKRCCSVWGTEVSTSSRKTRKVTFLPRVATSVPSLVRSCKPLGARLGHLCRLGLNLRGAPSVQLFDKALRYLKFSPKKERWWHSKRRLSTGSVVEDGFLEEPVVLCRRE